MLILINKNTWENKMKTTTILIMTVSVFLGYCWGQVASDAIRIQQNTIGFGARTLAMGGNGVVSARDYSALYWNPAGLASLRKTEFLGEISHLQFSNKATFEQNLNNMTENYTRLRSIGLAIPLPTTRGSMTLAFGYNYIRDFDDYLFFSGFNRQSNGLEFELEDENGSYNWYKFDRNVYQSEEVTNTGGMHQWSFGGAIAMSPNFDLGFSLNFWKGHEEYNLRFYQEDENNIYTIYPGDFHSYRLNHNLNTDYKAVSLKVGAMFRPNNAMQIGMAVETPMKFTVRENYSASDALEFDDGYIDAIDFEPGEWEYKVKTPFRFDAGLGLNVQYIRLNASATYRDWTQTRFEKPSHIGLDEDYAELLDENIKFKEEYRETIDYHAGAELALPNTNIYLRGGFALYTNPLKDATSEMDKKVYSGGIGLKIGPQTMIDVTYIRSFWQRESEDAYTPGGTFEDITENRILLGLRFQL
jgi:long-subunit fatty acid transport protein